ncbi:hypothetical protein [uncultured Sunxiuqinia sp.]|uniref:hypothetical protein n=1 Tax=Sunxiuqinia rutila TaxID=1397841 RepID=UPI002636B6B5|nr:hypothetical protein [uncultured Sunxiuqinia sp.]
MEDQEVEVLKFLKEVKQGVQNVKLNNHFFRKDQTYLRSFERLEELGFIYFIDGNYDLSQLLYEIPIYPPRTYWGRILPEGEEALKRIQA